MEGGYPAQANRNIKQNFSKSIISVKSISKKIVSNIFKIRQIFGEKLRTVKAE